MSTPFGFVPIGPIKATTLHIPVIIATLLLGVKEGFWMGLLFGMGSLFMSTFQPTPFSFCFSPFYSLGEVHGNFGSIIIAFIPRIMIAFISHGCYQMLIKKVNENISLVISSVIGSLTNTILVMSGIWLFFGHEYAAVAGFSYELFLNVIKLTVFTNGIMEAILAGVICLAIVKALKKRGNLDA